MEEIIKALFNNNLESKDVIVWLNDKFSNIKTDNILLKEISKFDFIKEFLMFIHNSSNCFMDFGDIFTTTPIKLKLNQYTESLKASSFHSSTSPLEPHSSTPISKSSIVLKNLSELKDIGSDLESFKKIDKISEKFLYSRDYNFKIQSPEPCSSFLKGKNSSIQKYSNESDNLNVPELDLLNLSTNSLNNSNAKILDHKDSIIKKKKKVFKNFFSEENFAANNISKNEKNIVIIDRINNKIPHCNKRNIGNENRYPNSRRITTCSLNFNNQDEFPKLSLKMNEKEKKDTCRRLTPTKIKDAWNSKNKIFDECTIVPVPAKSMPRSIWASVPKDIQTNEKFQEDKIRLQDNIFINKTEEQYIARIENVTKATFLFCLVEIYSYLFLNGFVSNIYTELFWLNQLLNTNIKSEGTIYFNAIDDVVYFATNVLYKILKQIMFCDIKIIRFLIKNERILIFKPEFDELLSAYIENINSESNSSLNMSASFCSNVSFEVEIDNRKNFPDDQSFHLFKRQRDNFYELLREFEENELKPDWTMKYKMTDRIQSLLASFDLCLVNRLHFIKLFIDQFIKTYFASNNLSFLNNSLFEINSSDSRKIEKLSGRLILPNNNQLNLDFPVLPEFYIQFISLTLNYEFCTLLCQIIYQKIVEIEKDLMCLEDANISMKSDGCEHSKNEEKNLKSRSVLLNCDKFVNFILTLRILGKLLGYVYFLPYKSKNTISQLDELMYLNIRNKVLPPFDILLNLKKQLNSGNIFFILMWVLDFLSSADIYSLKLKYFIDIIETLVLCYRYSFKLISNSSAAFILVVMLSFFFEQNVNVDYSLWNSNDSTDLIDTFSMDALLSIDTNVASKICPTISDITKIFIPNKSSTIRDRRLTHRKVLTQFISTTELKNDVEPNQNIQLQLKEAFLNRQSNLTKRCIEITSDSLSSQIITLLKDVHLVEIMRECILYATSEVDLFLDEQREQRQLLANFDAKAKESNQNVFTIMETLNTKLITTQVKDALSVLLYKDLSLKVVEILSSICASTCKQRIREWLTRYSNMGMFKKEMLNVLNKKLLHISKTQNTFAEESSFMKVEKNLTHLNNKINVDCDNSKNNINNSHSNIDKHSCAINTEKAMILSLNNSNNPHHINNNIIDDRTEIFKEPKMIQFDLPIFPEINYLLLPSDMMIMIKEIMRKLLTCELVIAEDVIIALNQLKFVVQNRMDLLENVKQELITMSVRLAFILIRKPNLWNDSIEIILIKIWMIENFYNEKLNLSLTDQISQQIMILRNQDSKDNEMIEKFVNNLKRNAII